MLIIENQPTGHHLLKNEKTILENLKTSVIRKSKKCGCKKAYIKVRKRIRRIPNAERLYLHKRFHLQRNQVYRNRNTSQRSLCIAHIYCMARHSSNTHLCLHKRIILNMLKKLLVVSTILLI